MPSSRPTQERICSAAFTAVQFDSMVLQQLEPMPHLDASQYVSEVTYAFFSPVDVSLRNSTNGTEKPINPRLLEK
jgi:hypothetical protein